MKRQVDPFIQIGEAIPKIALKLFQDKELQQLLINMSENPFSENDFYLKEPDFKNGPIRTVTKVDLDNFTKGVVVINPKYGLIGENMNFALVSFDVDIFLPLDKWDLNMPIQRPWLIMSKIYQLLNKSRVTGIGDFLFDSFNSDTISENVSLHTMKFVVDANG